MTRDLTWAGAGKGRQARLLCGSDAGAPVCRAIGVNSARRIPGKGTVCAKVLCQEGTCCVTCSEGSGQPNASVKREMEAMLLEGQTGV